MKKQIYLLISLIVFLSQGCLPVYGMMKRSLSEEDKQNLEEVSSSLILLGKRGPPKKKPAEFQASLFEESIPQEIKVHIFSYLTNLEDLLKAKIVCKGWDQTSRALMQRRMITLSKEKLESFIQGEIGFPRRVIFYGTYHFHASLNARKFSNKAINLFSYSFPDIASLEFINTKISPKGIENLSAKLTQLESLYLGKYDPRSKFSTVTLSFFTNLTNINLSSTPLKPEGLDILVKHQKRLKILKLSRARIGTRAAGKIAMHFPSLLILDLSENIISVDAAEAISKHLTRLEELKLFNNRIGRRGIEMVASGCINLKNLDVGSNIQIAKELDEGFIISFPSALMHLNLSNNKLKDEHIHELAESNLKLIDLNLSSNMITSQSVEPITLNLTKLESLDVSGNEIGNEGIEFIARNLTKLTKLGINKRSLNQNGVILLSQFQKNLQELILRENLFINLRNFVLETSEPLDNLDFLSIRMSSEDSILLEKLREAKPQLNVIFNILPIID